MKPRTCPYCHGPMPPNKSTGRPRRFCSDECRNAAGGRTDAEIAHDQALVADLNAKFPGSNEWKRRRGEL